MEFKVERKLVEIVLGDITEIEADAIVNAANEGLRGGGGVDGAIHKAGGPEIMAQCRKIGRCPTGSAVITTAGKLKAKYIIHGVGPVWHGGKSHEAELLKSVYQASLELADKHGLRSIAFPSITTGAYGLPIEQACPIAIGTVLEHLRHPTSLERVVFVLFSSEDHDLYISKAKEMIGKGN